MTEQEAGAAACLLTVALWWGWPWEISKQGVSAWQHIYDHAFRRWDVAFTRGFGRGRL